MIQRSFPVLVAMVVVDVAHAECPSVDQMIESAERALVEARLEDAIVAQGRAEAGFACGAAATEGQLGRFWRTKGVILSLQGRASDARESFSAANRVQPGVWTASYGADLERTFRGAVEHPETPAAELVLEPLPPGLRVWIDGAEAPVPALPAQGLHLVQAGPGPEQMLFGKFILIYSADRVVLSTGLAEEQRQWPAPTDSTPAASGVGSPGTELEFAL